MRRQYTADNSRESYASVMVTDSSHGGSNESQIQQMHAAMSLKQKSHQKHPMNYV